MRVSNAPCLVHDAWSRDSQDGSGVVGIVLVVLLFVVMFLIAFFVLYSYLVKLHLDGRLLDLYRRLCAPESAFVIPHDMEVCGRLVPLCVCRLAGTVARLAGCGVDSLRVVPLLSRAVPLLSYCVGLGFETRRSRRQSSLRSV